MARIFVSDPVGSGQSIVLSAADSHHLLHVLRLGAGDALTVVDGSGAEFLARIVAVTDNMVEVQVGAKCPINREPSVAVTLYQGLPKKDKLEWVIEKGTELGAVRFVPVTMARSVVKLSPHKAQQRQQRWQRIAESAAKQSLRQTIPEVSAVLGFNDMLHELEQQDAVLVPYERASSVNIAAACREIRDKAVSIVVGPEGGFADKEIEALLTVGARLVTLGPRILRTETAGIVSLALVLFATGNMGGSIYG